MKIQAVRVKELRELSGAGVMECRNVLVETEGNEKEALRILKERNLMQVQKKSERATKQGVIEAYIHAGGNIGAIVELNCETDFVARTPEFKELAHHVAMQVAAMSPEYVSEDEIPEGTDVKPQVACLLLQSDIRCPDMTVQDVINEVIGKLRENIKINQFARFELGS
ncbi:elongation factor Ts [Chloroflexota bacterium]